MKRDYIDFQDRSAPLAFLITFRTYGTWLHGDKRGSMDRREYNRYGEMNIAANPILKTRDKKLLRSDALILNGHQRYCVKAAIREVCSMRDYTLYAINVRTNHVHLVVVATTKVESMMNAFKAYATRRLRLEGLVTSDSKIWARHGSTRYLWTDKQVGAAIEYVMYEQGEDLPEF